jgi:hypothetical protein
LFSDKILLKTGITYWEKFITKKHKTKLRTKNKF